MTRYRPLLDRVWSLILGVSVRAKIMGMILGLTLVLGFGVTLQVRISMTRTLTQELEQRGISIGRGLAARSTDPILIHDTFALYQLIRDTVDNNPDLRYAFVLGQNGQILVHSFVQDEDSLESAGFPLELIEANRAASHERYHQGLIQTNEGLIHDFAVPIFEGRAGTARVGLSETRLRATVNAVTGQLLLTTLAVAIVGVAAAAFLTWLLTRPILNLVSVTRAVARGDLSQKAPRWADDEIGTLSAAFNHMVDDLATAQAESEAYNQELLRRNRELAVLNAVAEAASGPLALKPLLERALERVLELLNLEAGWVMLTNGSGDEGAQLVGAVGMPRQVARHETKAGFPSCPCGEVLDTAQPLVIHPLRDICPISTIRLKDDRPVTCHAAIPLIAKSRVLGVFNIMASDPSQFSPDDLRLLNAIGAQLGVAIENARLWEELKQKEALRGQLLDKVIHAQEEERQRIARELHDETSQALTSFMVGLKVLEKADSTTEVHQRATELRQIVADALEDVRGLALELRPSTLDDKGLIPTLQRYTRDYGQKFAITVDCHTLGFDGVRLLPRVETAVYRIIQEALTNVAKHANADTVSVLLEKRTGRLLVIVEDDGCGFDVDHQLRSGTQGQRLGLYGMRERANLIGGDLTIESRPGAGTTMFVEVGLDEIQVMEHG
ncbi:MAG: Oxygen sensor histidine kinase NreB [Anaerolineales bacterium]|nr:Oxygen sensor histidine kinase NreB [Anaerolineales bacterium]